jgi:hypothetical protein
VLNPLHAEVKPKNAELNMVVREPAVVREDLTAEREPIDMLKFHLANF